MSFYDVKNSRSIWFSKKAERLYWEQWYIYLNVAEHHKVNPRKSRHSKVADQEGALVEASVRRASIEATLREVLSQITKFVKEKKDHIPPIPSHEGITFPYEITIPTSGERASFSLLAGFCLCLNLLVTDLSVPFFSDGIFCSFSVFTYFYCVKCTNLLQVSG
ncbi:hypothetical protein Cgig2_002796 [Carnegiea gigantea]|uniref:Autophagy-related protein 101 n=1 Tax=Carnegiea gigantea TaxID=171969 RepID=A0A9Q1KPN9_9CARY|nr:hypothetical protein Cgig2_002796 [Carnegiea gigantea]